MSEADQIAPAPPKKPQLRRVTGILLGLVVLAVSLVAGMMWLNSETFLIQLCRWATVRSHGVVALEGAHGSLFDTFNVERVAVVTNDERWIFTNVEVVWRPTALLSREASIQRLDIERATIRRLASSADASSPPHLPQIHLPLSVTIGTLRVGSLSIEQSGASWTFSDVSLGAEFNNRDLALQRFAAATPWGHLTGDAHVASTAPHALAAAFRLEATDERLPYSVNLEANGTLSTTELTLDARSDDATLRANATLTPLAATPVQSVALSIAGLATQRFAPAAPHAHLTGEIRLDAGADGVLQGSMQCRNTAPRPLDQGGIPATALSADLSVDAHARLALPKLIIDLGEAGQVTGNAELSSYRQALHLATSRLNLRGLHRGLATTALGGAADWSREGSTQRIALNLKAAALSASAEARLENERLELTRLLLELGRGRAEATGSLDLTGALPVRLNGTLLAFDPAALGDFPNGTLNGSFALEGQVQPARGTVHASIAPSRLRGEALQGFGTAQLTPERLSNVDAQLEWGGNSLMAKGAFGTPGDRLTWTVRAPRLTRLDPRSAGSLTASGRLEGRWSQPAGAVDVQAQNLTWGQAFSVGQFALQAQAGSGPHDALSLAVQATGIRALERTVDRVAVNAQGRWDSHAIDMEIDGKSLALEAVLTGGLRTNVWAGSVTQLAVTRPLAIELREPAALALSQSGVELQRAELEVGQGTVSLAELTTTTGAWRSRGTFSQLRVRDLAAVLQPPPVTGDLRVRGGWALNADRNLTGRLELAREGGDLAVTDYENLRFGLTDLRAQAVLTDSRVQSDLNIEAQRLGRVAAQLELPLARSRDGWGVPAGQPLRGAADWTVHSFAWLDPLLSNTDAVKVDGTSEGHLQMSGTASNPVLRGQINARRLELALPDLGTHLKDGTLSATLSDRTLRFDRLNWRGGPGQIDGDGELDLRGPIRGHANLRASNFEVLSRPDRVLALTGRGQLLFANQTLQATGAFKADRGLIELARVDEPQPSADVTIVDKPHAEAPPPPVARADVDVRFNLGDRFTLKGKGMNAELSGNLHLKATAGEALRADGKVEVKSGTYTAYGNELTIDRGVVLFRGPLDDPGLDILAVRKKLEVEAGVAIAGTARFPLVQLYSNPVVPDNEKLAWLILGHAPNNDPASVDYGALLTAANVLLSDPHSSGLQNKIAGLVHLDELGVKSSNTAAGSNTLQSSVVNVGKRLSSKAYMSFEQGLDGLTTIAKLKYWLTKHFSVEARTGTGQGADILYTIQYD